MESGGWGRESFSGEPIPMCSPSAQGGSDRVPLSARDPHNRWPKTKPAPVVLGMQG